MKLNKYLTETKRTTSAPPTISESQANLLHALLGLQSESGEIADCIKKHVYYQQELDITNLKEELGDVMWYIALLVNTLDLDFHEILKQNIEKLEKRYPKKFTLEAAKERADKKEELILKVGDSVISNMNHLGTVVEVFPEDAIPYRIQFIHGNLLYFKRDLTDLLHAGITIQKLEKN